MKFYFCLTYNEVNVFNVYLGDLRKDRKYG